MKHYHLISGTLVKRKLFKHNNCAFISLRTLAGKRINKLLLGKATAEVMKTGSLWTIGYIEKPFFRYIINIRPGIHFCESENG